MAAACLALLCCVVAGCQSNQTTAKATVSPGALDVCTGCGQFKGSEQCCDPGAATCGGCGLAKGSPGCCKVEKGSNDKVAICTGCGQIKGSEQCCADGAAKCSNCGMAKGSPGCCKMPTDM